jgi:hypothetical protein
MRRLDSDIKLTTDPALLRFNPTQSYTFMMPGIRWRRFIVAFLLLGTPGLLFLINYRGAAPAPMDILWLVVLAALIAGFFSQILSNRIILGIEELHIRKDQHEFNIRYIDIEDAFIVDSVNELDDLPLPAGHYPMEFESRNYDIVALVLRDSTLSRSSAPLQDGVLTKYVSFNVSRPQRFLALLKMRV